MITVLIAILLSGCSSLSRKTSDPGELAAMEEARKVLLALDSQNEKLTNFKGVGKFKVWQNGRKRIEEKIVWIGSESVKLSIAVLIVGYPAVKMSSDGKWFYYYESRQGEPIYKRIPATDATLQYIASIPIKINDIIQLLSGRAPLREHHTAILHRQTLSAGYVLVLKKRWWGIVEKIFLSEDKAQVHQIEFFNRSGALIYRARFDEMQTVKGYQVPGRLTISGEEGVEFQLEIQRYLVDVPVSPSMFVLNPPD